MTYLTEFLLARIAEDEAVARGAIDPDRPGTHWRWEVPDDTGDLDAPRWLRTAEVFPTTSGVGSLPGFPLGFEFLAEPSRGMAHIARHDPARVLAECEAKRRIAGLHFVGDAEDWDPEHWACRLCQWDEDCDSPKHEHQHGSGRFPCETLRALALPYADHPDYRGEWRP